MPFPAVAVFYCRAVEYCFQADPMRQGFSGRAFSNSDPCSVSSSPLGLIPLAETPAAEGGRGPASNVLERPYTVEGGGGTPPPP